MKGRTSTMMDMNDESGLERLTWVVYDGLLLPSNMQGMYMLIYRGEESSKHCPSSTIRSANAECASQGARGRCSPAVQSLMQVTLSATSSYQYGGGTAALLDSCTEEEGDHPFHQHHMDKVKYGDTKQAVTASTCQEASTPSVS